MGDRADRIAYLDALIDALGWSHEIKRGGAMPESRGA
jgi:hypothetical protein